MHQTWYTHDNVLSALERADAFQAALDRSGLVFLYGTNSSPESMVFFGNELWDPATSADDGNFSLVMSPICATGWDDMSLKASAEMGVMQRISEGPVTGGVMGVAGPSYGQWGTQTGIIGAAMIDALHQGGSQGWVHACEERLRSMAQADPDLLDAIQSFVFYGDPLAPYAGAVQPTGAPTPLLAVGPRVVPNPFNPSTQIRFILAQKARVEVRVFDTRGRLIARPWEGEMNPGSQVVAWGGTDAVGKPVASGIYYARVKIDEQVSRLKLALIR